MRNVDVIALGELLVDFIQNGETSQKGSLSEASSGGVPYNVLAMLVGLGRRTKFIGEAGRDMFGGQFKKALEDVRTGACGLREDGKVPTTFVLVHRLDNGDRDFSLYKSPGVDMILAPEEVDGDRIERAEIFHFGSLSMTNEPVRATTKKALWAAEKAGVLRSFDPSLKPLLWKSLDETKEQIFYELARCDVLKISDNEVQWSTGKEGFTEGAKGPKKNYDIRLVCVFMERDGSRTYYGNCIMGAPGFI